MKKQVTDRYLTSVFSLLLTGMYCMVAINSFFMLMLSQQGLSEATLARVATATSTASLIAPFILGQLCDRLRLHKPLFFLGLFIGPLSLFIIRGTDALPIIVLCAVLLSGLCMNLQIIPAGWIASLNAGGRKIDFGFARSFGSLSFALMSVVVGIVLERFGMISMPVMMALMAVTVLIPVLMLPKPENPIFAINFSDT
jgi:PPP family 3-phenylpropionic acid transporter